MKEFEDQFPPLSDVWFEQMLHVPDPTPWSTASAETIIEDIKKYKRLFAEEYPVPRFFDVREDARLSTYVSVEQRFIDRLNAQLRQPFKITDV